MKLKLASLLAVTVFLTACECGDEDVTTSSQSCVEAVTGPTPGTAADFVTQVKDRVFFGFDKYDILENERKDLEKQAAWLLKYPETKVEIAGYCDPRGTIEYNDKLGQRRADAAAKYLASLGVDKGRIATISYGKRITLVPGATPEAYQQNRTAITSIK